MKKELILLILGCFTASLSAQINYSAFDSSTNDMTALMYGNLKIKTNNNLIIGHLNGSLYPNNGGLRIVSPTNFGHSYFDYQHNLYFRVESTPWKSSLALYQNGIVGINMQASFTPNELHSFSVQGHKLLVNGSILCEKIRVIGDVPNSDHVFENDYKLKPLSEVENFVTKNKHLPEIPSAKQFKENGYNIGEMDDLLLRKIEELTLYIIALEKKVKKLENK